MTKKQVMSLLFASLIVAATVLVCGDATAGRQRQKGDAAASRRAIPEFVVYEFVFRRYVFYKEQADRLERAGADADGFRVMLREEDNLRTDHARAFDKIAADCLDEAGRLDQRARRVIETRPRSAENAMATTTTPLMPDELLTLQAERDVLFRHGRVRLQAALGSETFKQFAKFVQRSIKVEHHNASRKLDVYSHSNLILDHSNGAVYGSMWATARYHTQQLYEIDLTTWIETEGRRTHAWSYALGYAPLATYLTAQMEADTEYSITGGYCQLNLMQ